MARGDDRKLEIMRVLDDGHEWTPKGITEELGLPSRGAVLNVLIGLQKDGLVEQVAGARPTAFRKAPGVPAAGAPKTAPSAPSAPSAPGAVTPEMIEAEIQRLIGGKVTAAKPAAAPAPEKKGYSGPKVIIRPSGLPYYVRVLAGRADVEVLRDLRKASVPAMLSGPPGTGKTAWVEAAFEDLLTVAGDGDTTVDDFVGSWTAEPGGGYRWIDGPLVIAMKEGRPLLVDDATVIPPKVMAVVYPAMDGRRQIVVKQHEGEIVQAKDGFYVVAAHNPGTHGAILSDALSSRFSMQIEVHTDLDLARTLKINEKAIRVAEHLASQVAGGQAGWCPQLRELLAFKAIEELFGEEAAISNLIGIAPEEDREVVIETIQSKCGIRDPKQLRLGAQIS